MVPSVPNLDPIDISRIEAIVFDLDGTLVDSTNGIETALRAAFQSAGRTMPEIDLRLIIGPPIREIALCVEPTLSESELVTIELSYRYSYDNEGWRDTLVYPSVADTLRELHRHGIRLFIVTNKPLLPTSKILKYLSLEDLFLETVTRDSRTPRYANKSEMLADLMSRKSLHRNTTLMVGDASEDQEAAHTNGLQFLHVTYGHGSVIRPAHSIRSFSEITVLLNLAPTQ